MSPIERLEARQAEIQDRLTAIPATAEVEERHVSDEEMTELRALREEFTGIDGKIVELRASDEIRARQAAAAVPVPTHGAARTELRSEPYRKDGADSYFLDKYKAEKRGDRNAIERLTVNDRYRTDKEQRAGATTVAGAGGEWAPPLWAEDQFVAYLRPGRVFADRLNKVPLPKDVSSINLPKMTGGTAVATQGTQNTAINIQDVTTTSVNTGITTIAGGTTVSLQLLQQSPISIDDVILKDLAKDLAKKIDIAAITAVAAVSGLNAVTYTDASPTSLKIAQQVQQGIDAVTNAIFEAPNVAVMRPERWGKLIAAGDSSGRPLVLPKATYGANNTIGSANGVGAEGYRGDLRALDVYVDANIPANLGTGTNQDEIFILKSDEINLYESQPEFGVFEQTFANNLQLFIRAHEFYGIIANRYPGAISLIAGTGLVTTLTYGS